MSQGQDQSLKFISNEYLKEFIKILPEVIDFEIDENTEIEILTEEQIVIEPSLYRPDFIARVGDIILMLEFQSTFVGIQIVCGAPNVRKDLKVISQTLI